MKSRRVIAALAVFVAVTVALTISMTAIAFGILWALEGFHDSLGLGMAVAVYSPAVVLFIVVSVGIALWVSHRIYFGRNSPQISN